jgi:uncharacterized membrane protein
VPARPLPALFRLARLALLARLSPLALWVDASVPRAGMALELLVWPFAFGMALGDAAFALAHPGLGSLLEQNQLERGMSLDAAAWALAGLLAVALVYWAAIHRALRTSPPVPLIAVTAALRGRLVWMLGLPFVVALASPGIATAGPNAVLLLAACAGLAAAATAHAGPCASPWFARAAAITRRAAPWGVGLVFVLFILLLGRITFINYRAFGTRTIDLGIYDNLLWHTSHGDILGSSLLKGGHHGSAHFDPILLLLSPFYRLRPEADTLLLLQVVWVGSTVFPLYLLAKEKLRDPRYGFAFAAMYAAHPAVHGATLDEFHSLTLVSPLLVWLLYFLERRATRAYAIVLAASLLCREDVSLVLWFVAAYAILRREPYYLRVGWLTALASTVYFVVVKNVFMDSTNLLNSGPASYGFSYYYSDLLPNGHGFQGLVLTLLTNPVFVLRNVIGVPKLQYVAILLLPLGFLPLWARPGRTLLIYGAIFCLLASRAAVYSIAFQYSSVVLPLAFPAAIMALEELPRWRVVGAWGLSPAKLRRALATFAFVASALVSWRLGALDPAHPFQAGYLPVTRALDADARERYAWTLAAVARIPSGASAAATPCFGPFISNRREAYDYPTDKAADYALVNEGELALPDAALLSGQVERGELVEIARRGSYVLFRARAGNEAATRPHPG